MNGVDVVHQMRKSSGTCKFDDVRIAGRSRQAWQVVSIRERERLRLVQVIAGARAAALEDIVVDGIRGTGIAIWAEEKVLEGWRCW